MVPRADSKGIARPINQLADVESIEQHPATLIDACYSNWLIAALVLALVAVKLVEKICQFKAS